MPIWCLVLSFLFCYIMGDLGVPFMLASLLSLSLIVAPAVGVLAVDSSSSTSEVSSDSEYVSPYEEWLVSFYETEGYVFWQDVLNIYKFPHVASYFYSVRDEWLSGLTWDYFADSTTHALGRIPFDSVVRGANGVYSIHWANDDYDVSLNNRGVWHLIDLATTEQIDFPSYWDMSTQNVNLGEDFISALRTDLIANNPLPANGTMLVPMIVDILVSGLVGLGSGLGIGISSFAQALAISDGALSVYFVLVVVFAGLALAVGLTTKIFNWLSSLGAN